MKVSWLGIKGTLLFSCKERLRFTNAYFLNNFLAYKLRNAIQNVIKGFRESRNKSLPVIFKPPEGTAFKKMKWLYKGHYYMSLERQFSAVSTNAKQTLHILTSRHNFYLFIVIYFCAFLLRVNKYNRYLYCTS